MKKKNEKQKRKISNIHDNQSHILDPLSAAAFN